MSKKQKDPPTDLRSEPRNFLELPTVVQLHDAGETWTEMAKVTSISRNGAGFSIPCPCTVGRLLKLVVPMPPELRVYDEEEELYPIMGLVQHCNKVTEEGEDVYHVGVALIGRDAPDSFNDDPLQNYRINGMCEDGLWKVTEAEKPFRTRQDPRFSVALDVTLALIQRDHRAKEATVTQNISAGGVSVESKLDVRIGDKVRFACEAYKFYCIARVRNRKVGTHTPQTLHLEFIENRFPVEKIPNMKSFDEALDAYVQNVEPDPVAVAGELGNFEFKGISF